MIEFLTENFRLFGLAHVLFMAIGVGGVTITDVLFFKFLRDHIITKDELSVMNTLSKVIWVAIGGAVLSGLGLFLPDREGLLESSKFLAKMTIFAIVLINGALLNFWIAPQMTNIFSGKKNLGSSKLHLIRKFAFALGAISIISWYSVFFLGAWRRLEFDYSHIIGFYLVLLFVAVIGSQVSERLFVKQLK